MPDEPGDSGLTRSDLIRAGAAIGATAVVLGPAAAAKAGRSRIGQSMSAAPKRGSVLRFVGSGGTFDKLEPAGAFQPGAQIFIDSIFEPLVYADNNLQLHPYLAVSWTPNATVTEWTFKLRDGVRFHDGSPLTAKDVAFSIRRVLNPKVGSPQYGALSQSLSPGGIQVVDKRTVKFRLKKPNSALPDILSTYCSIVQAGNTDPAKKPVGTGPFMFKSFKAGQGWEAHVNPRYWRAGLPYLDGIKGVVINDPVTMLQALSSGSATLTDAIQPAVVGSVRSNPKLQLLPLPNQFYFTMAMDLTQEPFTDPRVVRAVKLATDRAGILKVAGRNFGGVTQDVPVPQTDRYYPPDLKKSITDVQAAKQLLTAAGYPSGIDLELHTTSAIPAGPDIAQVFQQQVALAGIRVSIVQGDPATYFTNIWLKAPFAMGYFSYASAPLRLARNYASSGATYNESKFNSPKLDAALAAALATPNKKRQTTLYQQALRIAAEESGVIIPFFSEAFYGARKNLKGVQTNLGYYMDLSKATFV